VIDQLNDHILGILSGLSVKLGIKRDKELLLPITILFAIPTFAYKNSDSAFPANTQEQAIS
jgi:hypothetical protein